jgi:hypothetical protein
MVVRVGDRGRTLSPLQPQGAIDIQGKRYDALSDYDPIEPNCEVVVVRGSLQGLVVRQVQPGQSLRPLPDQGKVVHGSFGELVRQQGKQEDSVREEWTAQLPHWRVQRRVYGARRGALLGLLLAALTCWVCWNDVTRAATRPWLSVLVAEALGSVWGVVVFWSVDTLLQHLLEDKLHQLKGQFYERVVFWFAVLTLGAATAGVILATPALGLGAGLGIALLASVVLGCGFPVLIACTAEPGD